MKILYHHRIRSKDGQYVHVEELTQALQALGHELIIVAPAAMAKEEFGADSGLVAVLKRRLPHWLYELLEFGYAVFAYARLVRAVLKHRPECVYERYNLFQPAGIWLKKTFHLPLLLEVNAPLFEERRKYDGISLVRFARWTERYTWRNADFVLPVTQVLANSIERAGVPPSRIVVVPNGVNLERFESAPSREEAKRQLGLEDRTVVGFTGFLRDWHGLDHVIDILAKEEKDCHLVVVGDGPARSKLEGQIRKASLQGRVTLAGIVSRDEIMNYVAAFDVALQPAVVPYASPLKLFEYMFLACAIVAPSSANIREVLTDDYNALLFDPNDPASFKVALRRVCTDAALRARLGAAASTTILGRGLTWKANAETVIRLLS